MLNDKNGLNFNLEGAFVLVLENTLGLSAVTHYNRNTITNFLCTYSGVQISEWFNPISTGLFYLGGTKQNIYRWKGFDESYSKM